MKSKILKTNKNYQKALERFEEVFDAKVGTKESDEADILALLISAYEDEHYIIDPPTPIIS